MSISSTSAFDSDKIRLYTTGVTSSNTYGANDANVNTYITITINAVPTTITAFDDTGDSVIELTVGDAMATGDTILLSYDSSGSIPYLSNAATLEAVQDYTDLAITDDLWYGELLIAWYDVVDGTDFVDALGGTALTLSADPGVDYIPDVYAGTITMADEAPLDTADTDDALWFTTGTPNDNSVADLIDPPDWTRTLVKYDDADPHHIRQIGLLDTGVTPTQDQWNWLHLKFDLYLFFTGTLNINGVLKENRVLPTTTTGTTTTAAPTTTPVAPTTTTAAPTTSTTSTTTESLGAEKITNGVFTSGTSWGTSDGSVDYVSDRMNYDDVNNNVYGYQASGDMVSAVEVSTNYRITFDVSGTSGGGVNFQITNYDVGVAYIGYDDYTDGSYSLTFESAADLGVNFGIAFFFTSAGSAGNIDNVSLKEINP